MSQQPQPVPQGFHTLTPHLIVLDADQAIEFYKRAFGAELVGGVARGPDGKVMHALLRIGDSNLMLNDEMPEYGALSPVSGGSSSVTIHIYTPDVDRAFERAIAAGGAVERAVQDQFYGDRSGTLRDPFGISWTIATHIEDVSEEEVNRRMAAMMDGSK